MNRRRSVYLLAMIILLIVAVTGWFTTDYLGNIARQGIIEEGQASVLTLSVYVSATLSKYEDAASSLAGSPWIAPALLSKEERDIEQANTELDRYSSAFTAISYLMDADGMTVASSNRNTPDSFVGNNYSFRPYFQKAATGQPSRYFALGITSGKRGFYASYPVQNQLGEVVGVVTMKKDIDDLASFFRNYPFCFLISPDGIIFLSSTPAMVGKSLWPLDKAVQETLIASNQFGNILSEAFLKKEIADGTEVTFEENGYFVSREVIDGEGWSVVLLTPTDRIRLYQLIGILATISVGLLLFSGIIYVTGRSQKAIRQSEEKHRTLFETMMQGVVYQNADGYIFSANAAAEQILGLTLDQLQGRTSRDPRWKAIHEDGSDFPGDTHPAMVVLRTGKEVRNVIMGVFHPGENEYVWININAIPQFKQGETKPNQVYTTFEDITERKRAETALQVEKANLDAIFESSPIGMMVLDETTNIVMANVAMAVLAGCGMSDIMHHRPGNALRCNHSTKDPRGCGYSADCHICPARNGIEALLASGGNMQGAELALELVRNGAPQKVWLKLGAEPVLINGRRHLCVAMEDVTERKQAEGKLALNSQRTQALLKLNQMTEATLKEITDFVLEEAVRLTQSKLGYLAFLNEDESVLTMHSWSKSAMAECAINEKPIIYPVASTGLWGEAVRQRRPVITNDYTAANPLKKGYPQGHVVVKSHMNIPVFVGSRIVIVAGVGNKAEKYDKDDVEQLTLLMEGMWRLLERKRAEEGLQESETRLSAIFKNDPTGIFLVNEKTRAIYDVNDSALEAIGLPREEVVGKVCHRFLCPAEMGSCPICDLGQVVDRSERVLLKPDGTRVPILKTVVPIKLKGENYLLESFIDITDRKRAEEELRAASIYSRNLLETSLDPLVTISAEGRITDVNTATEKITGMSRKRLIGSDFSDYFTEPEMARAGYQKVFEQGQVTDYPLAVRHTSGVITEVLYNASVYRNEQGKVLGVFAAARDITERKKMEEALKKHRDHLEQLVEERTGELKTSEEKFRTIADFTYDWEYWIGPDGRMLYVSPSCERVTGFPPEQFYKDPGFIDTIIHPKDKAAFKEHVNTYHVAGLRGEPCELEFWIIDKGGREKLIAHGCRPVIGADGLYRGRRVSNRDVTERKKAEILTRCQRDIGIALGGKMRLDEAFAKVLDAAIGISGMDCGGVYLLDEASGALDLVLHKSLPADFVASSSHYGADSPNNQIVMRGAPIYASIPALDVDKYEPEGLRAIAIIPMLDSGKVIGCINVASHAADEVPMDARNGLEVLTIQASAALARIKAENEIVKLNVVLTRRKTELEESNKELEAFAYSVSHDLRAPLRTIDGFSHALLDDYDDKLDVQGKDYLRRVRAATQMMAQLIDDMLKLSRVTRTEMNIEKVNLTRIARSVIDELQKSQPERLINIKIADGLEDTADSRLMRLALENLLGNAWKFTGKQAEAVIEFGATKEGERKVYFIRDNGAGFDMAYVDKLFAPFQRLHTMEEYPGTGIGLATVRRIINRHGGKVWAEGQVGKGATFYFSLQG